MARLPRTALALAFTGLLAFLPVGAATAATSNVPPWPPGLCGHPAVPGFERLPGGGYHSCSHCQEDGAEGVSLGDWQEYYCDTWPVGLDVVHYLHVR